MLEEEVLKTFASDTMIFNTSSTKEIPAMSFVSSLLIIMMQPHLFSNYTHHPSSSKPPFPHTTTLPLQQAIMASCAAPGYCSQVVIGGHGRQ